MRLANGLNHLAINTKDIKTQIKFFTEVVGGELCALYWMHGATKTFHGFVRFSDTCSFAFVQSPQTVSSNDEPGHAAADQPGAMQHVALNVDSEAELLAIRDRVRSTGHWIMGPIDHGFCKSIYMAAPEGIMLEFCTSDGRSIDEEAWIDPEVMRLAGITAEELEAFKHPKPFVSQGGRVAQPPLDTSKPVLKRPPGGKAAFSMSDQEVLEKLSETTPPVQPELKDTTRAA
jgi:catechol 2,3-dioxygenase-like lactoylglutathione lyase family enzyme